MSGVLNAIAGGANAVSLVATIDSTGTGTGVDSSSNPSTSISPTSIKGATIAILQSTASPSRLDFRLGSDVAQDFFREIVIQGTDGALRRFLSSGATYDTTGVNATTWRWTTTADGSSSNGGWSAADTRQVLIYY